MTKFTVSLARVPIEISALFPSTERFCADYLTDDAPMTSVSVDPSDIDAERDRSISNGHAPDRFSDGYLETLALYRKITSAVLDFNAVLIHGSVVAHGGGAYMFTAPSGTGKTTHSRLWLDNIPDTHILNGDKPLIRVADGGVFACGTPWRGKERLGTNEILPLRAVCILTRAHDNHIEKLNFCDVLNDIIRQTHIPSDRLVKVLAVLCGLSSVEFYRLGCNTDPEAARVSFEGMVRHDV